MAGDSTFTMKFMNPHPLRIGVVKFDGKNNFGLWRCEVMDALTVSNLEDTLQFEKKRDSTTEKNWYKMNRNSVWLDQVLFDIRHQVSCVA